MGTACKACVRVGAPKFVCRTCYMAAQQRLAVTTQQQEEPMDTKDDEENKKRPREESTPLAKKGKAKGKKHHKRSKAAVPVITLLEAVQEGKLSAGQSVRTSQIPTANGVGVYMTGKLIVTEDRAFIQDGSSGLCFSSPGALLKEAHRMALASNAITNPERPLTKSRYTSAKLIHFELPNGSGSIHWAAIKAQLAVGMH
jgi:hypothetical protein